MQYLDASGQEATMGMLQEFIPNQGDGWSYTLSALQDYFQKVGKPSCRRRIRTDHGAAAAWTHPGKIRPLPLLP